MPGLRTDRLAGGTRLKPKTPNPPRPLIARTHSARNSRFVVKSTSTAPRQECDLRHTFTVHVLEAWVRQGRTCDLAPDNDLFWAPRLDGGKKGRSVCCVECESGSYTTYTLVKSRGRCAERSQTIIY